MTATVIPLFSRDRSPVPTCNCYPHQLAALTERISSHLRHVESELLVDHASHAAVLDDVLTTLGRIVAETMPPERSVR